MLTLISDSTGSDVRRLGFGMPLLTPPLPLTPLFSYITTGYSINYLDVPNNNLTVVVESINRILSLATSLNFPVTLALDGFEWWDTRPDLWNWFDPNILIYDKGSIFREEGEVKRNVKEKAGRRVTDE